MGVGLLSFVSSVGGSSVVLIPSIPGGGLNTLGGTTIGLYDGSSPFGTSKIGAGNLSGSGKFKEGITGGSAHSIT